MKPAVELGDCGKDPLTSAEMCRQTEEFGMFDRKLKFGSPRRRHLGPPWSVERLHCKPRDVRMRSLAPSRHTDY